MFPFAVIRALEKQGYTYDTLAATIGVPVNELRAWSTGGFSDETANRLCFHIYKVTDKLVYSEGFLNRMGWFPADSTNLPPNYTLPDWYPNPPYLNKQISTLAPIPPRRTAIADMQRVCAVLDRFDNAGYTTMSRFVNAVMAVRPTLDPNDVACFYDFLIHDPAFCDNMEAVYKILTSNLNA